MIQYRCLYKYEQCNRIFYQDTLDFEEEIELDRIILNRHTNEVKYLTKDGFWADLGYLETVTHSCLQVQGKITKIGLARFVGIERVGESNDSN